ncbi:NanoRNase/pAp phosphatase [Planctomycetes bacterium Pan216]|uniref:NanoRNase/pAp phosphatase n=1 Tax=Kolteria novifilia TaxID=2527975 RepID=A0A518B959_9BACT|nr:NanoRNase/pAp phosphatase [Planctomycetes bacterium Pan216]
MLNWRELDRLIEKAERVLLTCHVRPDGDSLGSELALADLLVQRGKEVAIYNPSPTPDRYRFLDPDGSRVDSQVDGVGTPPMDPDLFIVLDTGTWSQLAGLGTYIRQLEADKVVIDHHRSQDEDLEALRLVDVSAPACGMLIYDAFEHLHAEFTPQSAQALFVAISTDTGWMRHPTTSPEVFRALGSLVEHGAEPHVIHRELYSSNRIERFRLLSRMIASLRVELEGRLAVGLVRQSDITEVCAHPMDTEDFIDYLMSIKGVETGLLFIEQQGGGTKVSFRTRGELDCSKLAETFGGGGHRPAAGATVALSLDDAVSQIVARTEERMKALAT